MDQDQDQNAPPPDQDQGAPDQDQDQSAAPGDVSGDANFQTFYNDLSSEGTWVQTDDYGYAWQPNVQDPDWAPYTNGHWVYTDEGWTWVADDSEPWGWATYHYGRWVNIDGEGWVWVPGYTWAPAWVSWRYGDGYCGWAPLPPDTFIGIDFGGIGFGFHIGGDCDTAYGIGPGCYNFLPIGYLGGRDYRRHYLNRNNNFAFIGNTRNMTNIVVNNRRGAGRFGRVHVGGPNFATVNAQSHTPVQRMQLARSNRAGAATLNGNRLAVFAPHVNAAATGTTFRPHSVGGTFNKVQVNRGTDINQPLAVNSRVRSAGPTSAQVQAAQGAQSHIGAGAQVAMGNVRPTQGLSRPLASFQPHNEARGTSLRNNAAGVRSQVQASHPVNHAVSNNVRPENAFTGEAADNRALQNGGNREERHTVRNHVNSQAIQSHPQVNSNAEAERVQREQAERTQVRHSQVEQPHEQRFQERPVQHTQVQRQRAPVQRAAPRQFAAPAGRSGGGGHPANNSKGGERR